MNEESDKVGDGSQGACIECGDCARCRLCTVEIVQCGDCARCNVHCAGQAQDVTQGGTAGSRGSCRA